MSALNAPASFATVDRWARDHRVPVEDARFRFAQYLILLAIARHETLRHALVFKGGNALDFVLMPNRSTVDLDFSLDMAQTSGFDSPDDVKAVFQHALNTIAVENDVGFVLHSARRYPPGEGRSFVTWQIRVGYALPDESALLERLRRGGTSPSVIKVEVSLNEPLVENAWLPVTDQAARLRVSSLNDIVGEKLRSLLQQPIRNRYRRQDVLDLAVILANGAELDRQIVARALREKASARGVPVSAQAFRQPDIASRAQRDYGSLQSDARERFIPFDEAFATVLAFVDTLDIPAE